MFSFLFSQICLRVVIKLSRSDKIIRVFFVFAWTRIPGDKKNYKGYGFKMISEARNRSTTNKNDKQVHTLNLPFLENLDARLEIILFSKSKKSFT